MTFTAVGWIDVFTRKVYKDVIIDSLQYCISNKGLVVYAYVIMSNHIHVMMSAKEGFKLSDIIWDFKKYTSKQIIGKDHNKVCKLDSISLKLSSPLQRCEGCFI